jgi:hypothetical protein
MASLSRKACEESISFLQFTELLKKALSSSWPETAPCQNQTRTDAPRAKTEKVGYTGKNQSQNCRVAQKLSHPSACLDRELLDRLTSSKNWVLLDDKWYMGSR